MQSSNCTAVDVAQTFVMVDYLREITAKKSNERWEYGSSKRLLPLHSKVLNIGSGLSLPPPPLSLSLSLSLSLPHSLFSVPEIVHPFVVAILYHFSDNLNSAELLSMYSVLCSYLFFFVCLFFFLLARFIETPTTKRFFLWYQSERDVLFFYKFRMMLT